MQSFWKWETQFFNGKKAAALEHFLLQTKFTAKDFCIGDFAPANQIPYALRNLIEYAVILWRVCGDVTLKSKLIWDFFRDFARDAKPHSALVASASMVASPKREKHTLRPYTTV